MPVQRLEAILVVEDDIAAVAVAGVLRDDDLAVIRGIDRRPRRRAGVPSGT